MWRAVRQLRLRSALGAPLLRFVVYSQDEKSYRAQRVFKDQPVSQRAMSYNTKPTGRVRSPGRCTGS